MTPKYDESQHKRYVDCLRNALYEQNCKSVALSGSYGSGKSSILEQFVKEAKEDGHSVAKVSWQLLMLIHIGKGIVRILR